MKLSQILAESNFINANQTLYVRYMDDEGGWSKYPIPDAKEYMARFLKYYRISPRVSEWFLTVFLNWCRRDGWKTLPEEIRDEFSILSIPFDDFVENTLGVLRATNEFPHPSLKRYRLVKPEEAFERFLQDARNGVPAWAANGDVLFIGGLDGFLGSDIGQEMIDFLSFLETEGHNFNRMSVPDAIRLSDEWHNSNSNLKVEPDIEGTDIQEVMVGQNGRIVQLLTPKALDRESALCDHCVGRGGYDHVVINGSSGQRLFSIRDENNVPQGTIFLQSGQVIYQLKGPKNEAVDPAFWPLVKDFIIAARLIFSTGNTDIRNIGLELIKK